MMKIEDKKFWKNSLFVGFIFFLILGLALLFLRDNAEPKEIQSCYATFAFGGLLAIVSLIFKINIWWTKKHSKH